MCACLWVLIEQCSLYMFIDKYSTCMSCIVGRYIGRHITNGLSVILVDILPMVCQYSWIILLIKTINLILAQINNYTYMYKYALYAYTLSMCMYISILILRATIFLLPINFADFTSPMLVVFLMCHIYRHCFYG